MVHSVGNATPCSYPSQSFWNKGPLPPNTYGWGGVVTPEIKSSGFYFADFDGDKVYIEDGSDRDKRRVLKPEEVLYYNNSISLPPERKE